MRYELTDHEWAAIKPKVAALSASKEAACGARA
jgi:transposase